ncbi:hypothetical protein HLK56_20235 [Streptomyces sp. G9]
MVDTGRGGRVGEFRRVAGPSWSLRPVGGGAERAAQLWSASPAAGRGWGGAGPNSADVASSSGLATENRPNVVLL